MKWFASRIICTSVTIYQPAFLTQAALLTGILNTVFRQHAVAPIADTPNDLYAACPIRWLRVKCIIGIIFATSVPVQAVESLLEMPTNTMPLFTVWMERD
jgi:hypothetical protein